MYKYPVATQVRCRRAWRKGMKLCSLSSAVRRWRAWTEVHSQVRYAVTMEVEGMDRGTEGQEKEDYGILRTCGF